MKDIVEVSTLYQPVPADAKFINSRPNRFANLTAQVSLTGHIWPEV
jgi:hypothetical protein